MYSFCDIFVHAPVDVVWNKYTYQGCSQDVRRRGRIVREAREKFNPEATPTN